MTLQSYTPPFPDEFLMTVVPSSGKDFVNHSITSFPEPIKSAVIKFTSDNYTNPSKEVFNSPH